jgi:two-component system, sensor histidine kinase YesM
LGSLSIKTNLTILIVLTVFVPLILFGLIWYEQSTKVIEKNATRSSVQIVGQLNHHLDYYFNDLERNTLPIFTHPLIQQLLKVETEDLYNRFYLRRQIKKEVIPSLLFSRPDISGISIVSNDGLNVTSFGSTSGRIYTSKNLQGDNYKILGVSQTGEPILTVARKLIDKTSYQSTGLLLIDIKLNQLSKIINDTQLGKTGMISIVNSDGAIIYHQEKTLLSKKIPASDLKQYLLETNGSVIKSDAKGEKIVTFNHSPLTNLITIAEVPKKELMGELLHLRNIAIVSIILITFISLLVIVAFSFKLIKSLTNLQKKMKEVEMGNLHVRADEGKKDEIGRLNRSFNTMVNEMERLIEDVHKSELKEKEMVIKQREAVLQSMQFQVNPHFLYNTLEIINSHAIVEGNVTISRMSTALADIFRYAVEGHQYQVTLYEEMENIMSFIEIQKERYRYLKVEIVLDETTIPKVNAIKLILQPIVENAFKHGYEANKIKPEYLKIAGQQYENYYLLEIVDKGKGMRPEDVSNFNHAFELRDFDQINTINYEMLSKGIGLWNVHFRLRSSYGYPYGINIKESTQTGTVIQIKLPLNMN